MKTASKFYIPAECIFRSISLNVTGNLRNETDFNYNKLYICPIAQAFHDRKINSPAPALQCFMENSCNVNEPASDITIRNKMTFFPCVDVNTFMEGDILMTQEPIAIVFTMKSEEKKKKLDFNWRVN